MKIWTLQRRLMSVLTLTFSVAMIASPSGAAESTIFSQLRELCEPNHADSKQVLAAADRDGWQVLENPQLAAEFNEMPSPYLRIKNINGQRVLLATRIRNRDSQAGTIHTNSCSISGSFDNIGELGAAVRQYLNAPPAVSDQVSGMWFFANGASGRTFFDNQVDPKSISALKGGRVMTIAFKVEGSFGTVTYMESSLPSPK